MPDDHDILLILVGDPRPANDPPGARVTSTATLKGLSRLPALDGVRGISALGIFGTHAFLRPLRGAWIAVDVFFVLSGYLITTILLREHGRNGRLDLRRFFGSRIVRLYPVLLITVVAGCVLYQVLPDEVAGERSLLRSALATVTYTENLVVAQRPSVPDPWSHTWSLAEEEQFYLVWPVLLAGLLAFARTKAVYAAAGLAVASAIALLLTVKGAYYLPWTHASGLAVGAVMGLALFHDTGRLTRPLRTPLAGWIAVAGLLALVTYLGYQPFASKHALVVGLLGTAVLSGLLVGHLACNTESLVSRGFAWRPIAQVGRWSYGFYLVHVPLLATLGAHLDHWTAITIAFVVTLLWSAMLHKTVERPLDKVRHRVFAT